MFIVFAFVHKMSIYAENVYASPKSKIKRKKRKIIILFDRSASNDLVDAGPVSGDEDAWVVWMINDSVHHFFAPRKLGRAAVRSDDNFAA